MTARRRGLSRRPEPGHDIGFVGLGNMGGPMVDTSSRPATRSGVRRSEKAARGREVRGAVVGAVPRSRRGGRRRPHAPELESSARSSSTRDCSTRSRPARSSRHEQLRSHRTRGRLVDDRRSAASTSSTPPCPAAYGGEGRLADDRRGRRGRRVEAARPLLEVVGARALHVGGIGAGHALKALNNLLSAATLIATSEAVEAGRRFGLDPAVMIDAFNTSSGRSYSTQHKFPDFVLPGTYDDGFNINLMVKDIGCALDLAESTGSPSTVTEVIVEQWRKAAEDLPQDTDHTTIAKWIHEGRGG